MQGARWYKPGTGTFTARDTVYGMLKTPVSLNRYTYANGDPLQYSDPDGRWPAFVDRALNHGSRLIQGVWSTTGEALTGFNRRVVQPALRTASVQGVTAKAATLTRTHPSPMKSLLERGLCAVGDRMQGARTALNRLGGTFRSICIDRAAHDSCQTIAERNPKLRQAIADTAGGVLKANPITMFLPGG